MRRPRWTGLPRRDSSSDEATPGSYHFAHALVRETVLGSLTATRRALLHRRIAEAIERLPGGRRESRLPDLARHLLEAHPLIEPDRVAEVVLRAAERAIGQFAYEDAAALLERALAELDVPDPQRAALLLALGDAQLRVGHADVAQHCFAESARLARAVRDGELLARAALGAAGFAVTIAPARADICSLLEEAVASVDASSPLRAALLARLSIERYYDAVPVRMRLSAEALAGGRRAGGRALLEALNARHVALWSPPHVEERLAIADELIDAGRAAGDREAELQGMNWRVVDLLELGEMTAARRAIDAHGRLADDLRLLAYAWYRPMWLAMLALLAGRPKEASRLSAEGARIGRATNDENARVLFEVQSTTIKVAQGRRLVATDRAAAERGARRPAGGAWRAWFAMLAFDRGDTAQASRLVAEETARVDALAVDANWLYTVTTLSFGAWLLNDTSAAAALYPRLLPYADRVALAGRGTHCTGSVELHWACSPPSWARTSAPSVIWPTPSGSMTGSARGPLPPPLAMRISMVLERRGGRESAEELRSEAFLAAKLGMTLPQDIARYL